MIDGICSCWDCRFCKFFDEVPYWEWGHPEAIKLFTNNDPKENFRLCPYKELEKEIENE